jgi:hypothetical protein
VTVTGKDAKRAGGKLPPHVMVYFVMALALFADDDCEEVAARLTQTLRGWGCWDEAWEVPASGGITQARQRLGPEPLAGLSGQVAVPVAGLDTAGAARKGGPYRDRSVLWEPRGEIPPGHPARCGNVVVRTRRLSTRGYGFVSAPGCCRRGRQGRSPRRSGQEACSVFMIVKGFAPENGVKVFVITELCSARWIAGSVTGAAVAPRPGFRRQPGCIPASAGPFPQTARYCQTRPQVYVVVTTT